MPTRIRSATEFGGVLRRIAQAMRGPRHRICRKCGYDLRGTLPSADARCPECSAPYIWSRWPRLSEESDLESVQAYLRQRTRQLALTLYVCGAVCWLGLLGAFASADAEMRFAIALAIGVFALGSLAVAAVVMSVYGVWRSASRLRLYPIVGAAVMCVAVVWLNV